MKLEVTKRCVASAEDSLQTTLVNNSGKAVCYAALFLARLSLDNPHETRWNAHMLTACDLKNVPVGSPVQPLVEQAAPVEVQSLDLSRAAAEHAANLLEPEAL